MRWLAGTVVDTTRETASAATLRLDVPGWPGHRAGQHVDVRLTAEDGYSASRSYSIASAPGADLVDLTVACIADGEVSPYLANEVGAGDLIELRGPIGGYFVWDPSDTGPVLLVGGGSGVVPLMAMLRHHAQIGSTAEMRLVCSARTLAHVLYRRELDDLADDPSREVTVTLTRETSDDWAGRRGRVDADLLETAGWPPAAGPRCYVCGPTSFVETCANTLVAIGHAPANIRTERFGPTGG